MLDLIITEANAFDAADLIVRNPDATKEQIDAAAAVLAQSPDWKQRVLGREVRAGLYAQRGAELKTDAAVVAAKPEPIWDYVPDMHQFDTSPCPDFAPDFSHWKRDLALVAGFILAFSAVIRWWPL